MKVMTDEQALVKIWEEAQRQMRIVKGYKQDKQDLAGRMGLISLHGYVWGLLVSADILDMRGNLIKGKKK